MTEHYQVDHTKLSLDTLAINTIRFLSIDAVQKANSGHPGLPMDAAPMAYVLWMEFLKYNPHDPKWFDRDRFVLSAGHGSMLLYSLLYLTGYDLSLDQIKSFRQFGSVTPGHPERELTPGVEVTTGPLGQGFANGVGMAIAEANLAARFNRPDFPVIDHYTYSLVSDGDLMEGISSEASSLAGELKLGKLIYLYDNNRITLSGSTNLTFTEDVIKRYQAYGWHTQTVDDGNDLGALRLALQKARDERERPSIISVRTHIGYGSPHKQDTYEAHGSPLGPDEVKATKENLGWPLEPAFYIPSEALDRFRQAVPRGEQVEAEWNALFERYQKQYPQEADELKQMIAGQHPNGWTQDLPRFKPDAKGMATRTALGKAMNATAARLPALIGGSADLDPSTYTALKGLGDFGKIDDQGEDLQGSAGGGWSYAGRNIHFGVREHAMGAVVNGIAAHGGLLPYSATFLVFSDYMRPPIRLAAISGLQALFIFTHDSIGLGEDGPTHQPVEQLVGLRSIPRMVVIRPGDANETAAAWQVAVEHQDGPVILVLSRQTLPVLDPDRYPAIFEGVRRGGYILAESQAGQDPQAILVATGSEVHLAIEAQQKLAGEGHNIRVVSMPSWNLFIKEPDAYQRSILPVGIPILSIEAGASLGWKPYFGPHIASIGVDTFGASAPGEVVMEKYGFTVENICQHVYDLLGEKPSTSGEQEKFNKDNNSRSY